MRKSQKLFSILLSALTTAGLAIWFAIAQAAGTATLTLTPSSGSHESGTNFTVVVHESSTDQINVVQADLVYDQSKLQFVSIDTSNSTFDYSLASSGGSGSVSIVRGVSSVPTVSGNQTVGSVTFKVLTTSGSSPITFASSSAIYKPSDSGSTNVWNGGTTGGTYSFTQPAAPPPSTPPDGTATPPSSTTTSTSSNASTSTSKTTAKAQASNAAAQAADPEAPVEVSNDIALNAGYPVAIKVVDDKDKALQNASVTLNSKSAKTDATGIASFTDIPAGKYEVIVKANGKTVKSNIEVQSGKTAYDVQEFKVKLKGGKLLLVLEIAAGIIGLFLLLVGIIRKLRKNRLSSFKINQPSQITTSPSPNYTEPSVISPDKPPANPDDDAHTQT